MATRQQSRCHRGVAAAQSMPHVLLRGPDGRGTITPSDRHSRRTRLLHPQPILLALLLSVSCAHAGRPSDPPKHIFGTYTFKQNRLCEVGSVRPNGSFDWINCYSATDTIEVFEAESEIDVNAQLHFSNGHACTFEGKGGWDRDRVVASSTSEPHCLLTLFFFGGAVHTVATEQCQCLCDSRGSLNHAILNLRSSVRQ